MNKTLTENKTFATLMDVIEQSGMTTAAAAITGQLVGSDDILTDGGAGVSSASMNPLEDDIFDSRTGYINQPPASRKHDGQYQVVRR